MKEIEYDLEIGSLHFCMQRRMALLQPPSLSLRAYAQVSTFIVYIMGIGIASEKHSIASAAFA